MSRNYSFINVGQTVNDKHGDPLRTAFTKVNSNFQSCFDASLLVTTVPTHNYGQLGDSTGDVAFDSTYFYVCFRDYVDNATPIWRRVAWDIVSW